MEKSYNISFQTAVYVDIPKLKLFNSLRKSLPCWSEGDINFCITYNDLTEILEDEDISIKIRSLLKTIIKEITNKIKDNNVDIIFYT